MSKDYRLPPRSYRAYLVSIQLRDRIFSILARPLAVLHVKPNSISFFGVAMAILFLLFIKTNPQLALLFLGISLLSDALDGALSRYQRVCSDRGKFVDVTCDNVVFSIFITGLVAADILAGLVGLVFLFTTILSKIFRIIWNNKYFESDWKFKPVAGFVPNLLGYTSYALFALFVFAEINYFDQLLAVFSLILISDALVFFHLIINAK